MEPSRRLDHRLSARLPPAAPRIARRILESVNLLSTQPHMGRPGRILGTREWVVPDTPDIIPCRIKGERPELIAVFHDRRKWPEKL
ncbi:MAG: type II toxin-antitoxin system RelE/ParE family toxin [Bryobacteraceae bacterium]|jgi:toxin ParE1/3/4